MYFLVGIIFYEMKFKGKLNVGLFIYKGIIYKCICVYLKCLLNVLLLLVIICME